MRGFGFGLLLSWVVFSFNADAGVRMHQDRAEERARLLKLIEKPPVQRLRIIGAKKVSERRGGDQERRQAFVETFKKELWPYFSRLEKLSIQSAAYELLIDRALQNDDEELAEWKAAVVELHQAMDAVEQDPVYRDRVRRWAAQAKNLDGEPDLAIYAGNTWNGIRYFGFPAEMQPSLQRLRETERQVVAKSNESAFTEWMGRELPRFHEVVAQVRSGQVSFAEGAERLAPLLSVTKAGYASDFASRARAELQEQAVLRSRLAKSAGRRSWAELMAYENHDYFESRFRTVPKLRAYLEKILARTDEMFERVLDRRLKQLGRTSREGLNVWTYDMLKFPEGPRLGRYFPKEQLVPRMFRAITRWGYDPALYGGLTIDGEPREGKHTHAYYFSIVNHTPKSFTVDARTLRIRSPRKEGWNRNLANIVWNHVDEDPEAPGTLIHELHHWLDYAHRKDRMDHGSITAYDETLSTMGEFFLTDPVFLRWLARDREGQHPSKEDVEAYIEEAWLNRLMDLRTYVARSLIDIDLWDTDFTAEGADFVERMRELTEQHMGRALGVTEWDVQGLNLRDYLFEKPHFYWGSVDYYAYILAMVGGFEVFEALLDYLDDKTGKRTIYGQSELSDILIEGIFEKGFEEYYPAGVRAFTGRRFSEVPFLTRMKKAVRYFERGKLGYCEAAIDGSNSS